MESKQLHEASARTIKRKTIKFLMVTGSIVLALGGCQSSSLSTTPLPPSEAIGIVSDSTESHVDQNRTAGRYTVPYRVPVKRNNEGIRATDPSQVRRCPNGALRYCDHRRRRCSCVSADAATRALETVIGGF